MILRDCELDVNICIGTSSNCLQGKVTKLINFSCRELTKEGLDVSCEESFSFFSFEVKKNSVVLTEKYLV